MAIEEPEFAFVDAEALPHAIAEHETAVEYRNDGLAARLQLAVHVDQDFSVSRVRNVVHLRHARSVERDADLGKCLRSGGQRAPNLRPNAARCCWRTKGSGSNNGAIGVE